MLKLLKYILLIISSFYLIIANSETAMHWAANKKIFPDDYRYGDLYRLSNLPQFKQEIKDCQKSEQLRKPSNNNLYVIGDSFGLNAKLDENYFVCNNYTFVNWDKPKTIKLDTSKKNILILESVERSIKMHFTKPSTEINLGSKSTKTPNTENWIISRIESLFENIQNTENRLTSIFNYDFILFFKEIKASFDLKVFNEVSPSYVVSTDQKNIFYFEEANASYQNSAFYNISDTEIDYFVSTINNIAKHYKSIGFDEVYLAIIPNKVSILNPEMGKYNHALERIQNHKNLAVEAIDIYSVFKKSPENIYFKSDTHWNCNGSKIWQKKVNETIFK